MNRHLLVGLIGAALWGAQESVEKHSLQYQEKGRTISVLGACTVDEDIVCWDPQGVKNDDLTNRVKAGLAKADQYGEMAVKAEMRPRLVITEMKSDQNSEQFSFDYHESTSRGDSTWTRMLRHEMVEEGNERTQTTITAIGVNVDKDTKTGSIFLRVPRQYFQTLRLEPEIGSTTQVGDWQVTLTTIKPLPDEQGTKRWELGLKVSGTGPVPSFQVFAEDKQHKYIRTVDRKGKPVKEEVFAAELKKPFKERKAREVGMYSGQLKDGVLTVISPIDPSTIGGLGVSGNLDRWVEISGFAVDPKPGS